MSEIRIPQIEQSSSGGGESVDAGRLFQALWRGKWYFLLFPAIAGGGMYYFLHGQKNLYRSTAQVQVAPREVDPLNGNAGSTGKARTLLKQQQILVKSPAILKPLSESKALRGLKSFSREIIGSKPMITELNDRIGTVVDPNTDRLSIAYLSPFPDEAAKIARATVEEYIAYHKRKKRESAEESAAIIRGELGSILKVRDDLTEKIIRLRTENNITQGGETLIQARLTQTRELWTDAHFDMLRERATFELFSRAEADAEKFLDLGRNRRSTKQNPNLEPELQEIEKDLLEKELQLQRRERDQGDLLLAELRDEVAVLKERKRDILLQYARNYKIDAEIAYNEAKNRETSLDLDVTSLQEELGKTNRALQQIDNYESEFDSIRDFSEHLKSRLNELDVENQTGALNILVIDYGRPSNTPASPDRVSMMAYALAGGVGLAFAIVMLRSFSDKKMRIIGELPHVLNVNVVGVMPRLKGPRSRARTGRIVEEQPGSSAAEAIRNLRTATTFALPKDSHGVVLVTSSVSGEGKSVTASNLAFALATGGRRTLLIDGDLRMPSLHEIYGVENLAGLGQVMTRSITTDKVIVQNVAAGLDLMPAGDPFGKPAELFESGLFPKLLDFLRKKYDCIVVDSPPILESSESRVMASEVDLCIFVTRLCVSTSPNAIRALGILRGVDARVVGTFVNDDSAKKTNAYAGGIAYGAFRKVEALEAPLPPRSDAGV
ncbi:MAG: hypothetical protein CMJ89_09750 [Planctomycetes bacterium]|jgi:capsular exopolysaccharide synthesis family protein|nr:hypothetical protein [Planctomycetota bacterium]